MKTAILLVAFSLATFAFLGTVDAAPGPQVPDLFDCLPEDDQCKCLDRGGGVRCFTEQEPCNLGGRGVC